MNQKKAKALRAMAKKIIQASFKENAVWVSYKTQDRMVVKHYRDEDGNSQQAHVKSETRVLSADCGKYIYNQLKKEANQKELARKHA